MAKSCFCGCEHFRFLKDESGTDEQMLYYNICINCNHTLAEHIKTIRTKQAD